MFSTFLAGILIYFFVDFVMKFFSIGHLPGPVPLPFVGTMYNWEQFTNPSRYLRDARNKYGPVFVCWFGPTPWIFVSGHEEAKAILTQEKVYPKDETYSKYISLAFREGLISVVDHQKHRKAKTLLLPYFTQKKTDSLVPTMVENTLTMIKENFTEGKNYWENFDVNELNLELTYRFITKYVMNYDCVNKGDMSLIHVFTQANIYAITAATYRTSTNIKINHMAKYLNDLFLSISAIVDNELEERKQKNIKIDDCLQALHDSGMDGEEVKGHLSTLIGAGHDTTSYLISMCIFMMAKHPQVQKKVQEEIEEVFQGRKDLEPEDFKKLKYLQATMKESMRLNTIVGAVTRKVVQDNILLKKYRIPKGSQLMVALFLLHKNFENHTEFQPERWLGQNYDTFSAPGTLPFSYGSRTCIGKTLSLTESMIALVLYVQELEFEPVPGYKPKLAKFGVSNVVTNGVKVSIRRRKKM